MTLVYLETTVVGHLVGRMHRDLLVAARQMATRAWWENEAPRYELLISDLVIDECSGGDADAAAERLAMIEDLPRLAATTEAAELAHQLMTRSAIPATEPRDALHIALAAVHGVEYLLTWNFKHIANASRRHLIELVCRDHGESPPTICTPEELASYDDPA